MRRPHQAVDSSKDPFIIGATAALRRAAKRALELGLRTGTPVYVMEKGRMVGLTKKVRRRRAKGN